jgi:hypothetical protein
MIPWTWMRFSYCHPVIPEQFWHHLMPDFEEDQEGQAERLDEVFNRALTGRYVRLIGTSAASLSWDRPLNRYFVSGERGYVLVDATESRPYWGSDIDVVFEGRVVERGAHLLVDATASRWHPASIAGLVVGAMGVFIFGLYLQGWLRGRKALAGQPGRDIIA